MAKLNELKVVLFDKAMTSKLVVVVQELVNLATQHVNCVAITVRLLLLEGDCKSFWG